MEQFTEKLQFVYDRSCVGAFSEKKNEDIIVEKRQKRTPCSSFSVIQVHGGLNGSKLVIFTSVLKLGQAV